jgi:peptidoglycan/LPS O-acetylase OafA/YrhL
MRPLSTVTKFAIARASLLREGLRDLWKPPASQVPALDALRAAAILMVVAGHFADVGKPQFPRYAQLFDGPLFLFGWTGVDLFFVLSGFLIGRQLWKEQQRTGTVKVRRFILRRGLRIWPLYVVVALLSPALVGKWSYRWGDWAFLSNYVPGRVDGGWSLSTEEQFYILAPLTILACSRFFRVRDWFIALGAALVAVSGVRWWTAHKLLSAGESVAKLKTDMYSPFHLHNEGLTIGLLIALVSVVAPELLNGSSTRRRQVFAVAFVTAAIAILLRAANGIVFPFLSLALIYGSIMVVLLALGPNNLRPLKARAFYTISRLSYGMYLNHFAVLRWIAPSIARAAKVIGGQNPATVFVSLSAVVVCSATFAAATFVLVEHPFLLLRGRMLRTSPAASAATTSRAVALPPAPAYDVDGREAGGRS